MVRSDVHFLKRVFNVNVIAEIVILKSAAMAKFMNANVAGISVPENIIQEMEETAKEDRKKKAYRKY